MPLCTMQNRIIYHQTFAIQCPASLFAEQLKRGVMSHLLVALLACLRLRTLTAF